MPRHPPFRSRKHFHGLPWLNDIERRRVSDANLLVKRTIVMLYLLVSCNVPRTIENPATSQLWLVPYFRHSVNKQTYSRVCLDYCQYGEPWRKRTAFLCYNVCGADSLASLWEGRSGLCSASNALHIVLRGKCVGTGRDLTKKAGPYPSESCRALAYRTFQQYQFVVGRCHGSSKFLHGMVPDLFKERAQRIKFEYGIEANLFLAPRFPLDCISALFPRCC